jgi:hypothetical protein
MAGVTMLAEPAQSPPPRAASRRGRWLVAAAAAWALLVAGAGYWSVRHDGATVREQRGVAQALPVAQRAVRDLVAAAGPAAVLAIGAPRLAAGCRLTAARKGATLEWAVRIFAPPAEAAARLEALADRLPEAYRVRVRRDHTIRADAGEFVGVRGGVSDPGAITLTVATGCRPDDGLVIADGRLLPPPDLVAAAAPVASALGFTAGDNGVGTVVPSGASCPGGAVTARWSSPPGGVRRPLADALRERLAGAAVALQTAELVAYRRDGIAVVVETADDKVLIAATRTCGGQ